MLAAEAFACGWISDAGCGSGSFAIYSATRGNETVGISYDKSQLQTARSQSSTLGIGNLAFFLADLRDLDQISLQLGAFDQVICFETIEHILDDDKLIGDLGTLLIPGGQLLLVTPSRQCRPMLGDRVSDTEDGGHVRWGYTHYELQTLLRRHGLEVVVAEYVSGVISQQITNLFRVLSLGRAGSTWATIAWLLTFPLRTFQFFDPALTKLLNYPHMSVAVVGSKPSE